MNRELRSKRSGKYVGVVNESEWDILVTKGDNKKYIVTELTERKLIQVPIITPEKIKTIKKNG